MIPNRFIYGLVDPRDGRVRYVGKTSVGLKRPKSYLTPVGDAYKDRWVRSLRRLGAVFKIRIAHFRKIYGKALTNRTKGGDGGALASNEWSETTYRREEAFGGSAAEDVALRETTLDEDEREGDLGSVVAGFDEALGRGTGAIH